MLVLASSLLLATLSMPWLRIVQINDVYELDNFPHLKTLVDQYDTSGSPDGPDICIAICAGDFLAPSLLSSLDKGTGMVDILNAVGCDYVCLGNHETDVGDEALVNRIKQSNFEWINSNLPDLRDKLDVDLPKYKILEVGDKKVALLGLMTEDPSLYRPGAFGGASIQPILESAKELVNELEDKVDLVLPMTHQGIGSDRSMAQEMGNHFPLLMGGHDHEPYLETVNGCRIVKTGMDAIQAAVIDIRWENEEDSILPSIEVQMLNTKDFAADPSVKERVDTHESILKELDKAKLFAIKDWVRRNHNQNSEEELPIFTTKDNRLGPSTGTSALCSMLRMGLRCHVALMNAGCVRAGKDYDPDSYFTWSDMKAELPYPTNMCVGLIPGRVLQETIQFSRRFAKDKVAKGGFIHASRTTVCTDEGEIQTIMGKKFDPDKEYLTAFPHGFLAGIDNQEPLLDWAATKKPEELPSVESAIPAKLILVELLSALLWMRFGTFEEVAGGDGVICKHDVRDRMRQLYGGNHEVADLMADSVFAIADKDGNGTISAVEQIIVHFVAADMLDHIPTDSELKVMKKVAFQVLGKDPSHHEMEQLVDQIKKALDLRGTGSIQREEIIHALGEVAGKDFLL